MYLVCWNHDCRQTYDSKDYKPTDRNVKCPKCGDIIISNSGKVQMSMNPYVMKTLDPAKLVEKEPEQYVKLKHVEELLNLFKARDSFHDWSKDYEAYDTKIRNTIDWLKRNAKEKEDLK